MDAYITQKIWNEMLKGWVITDVAVRDRNIVYLCLREKLSHKRMSEIWDHQRRTQHFAIFLDTPDDSYGYATLRGYDHPKVGVALQPKPQGLLVSQDMDGVIQVMGSGVISANEKVAPGENPMTARLVCINGYTYSVGWQRKIYKRVDMGKWERFADLPRGKVELVGFEDMDAFSEDEMYAVGGHGDVWMYNGKEWQPTGFPTNKELNTVTCAGDGNVYISSADGGLWRGRRSNWERIYKGGSTIPWNDALWFEGKLWLASDYQLRVWDGKELQKADAPNGEVPNWGHMDARDGLLVVASMEEVMAYDGKAWRTLVSPYLD
jgi:hypothetical protein